MGLVVDWGSRGAFIGLRLFGALLYLLLLMGLRLGMGLGILAQGVEGGKERDCCW